MFYDQTAYQGTVGCRSLRRSTRLDHATPDHCTFYCMCFTDGTGTGTVVVRLADVNDNSPRLARQLWQLEVDETWGDGPPGNHTILEVSAADRDDTSNYFYYRVSEGREGVREGG